MSRDRARVWSKETWGIDREGEGGVSRVSELAGASPPTPIDADPFVCNVETLEVERDVLPLP